MKVRRGFSFDGAMPWASKTPKGRDKTSQKPWVLSLIKTPEEMADLLTETSVFKEGYHLADVLSISALIYGDRSLFESYSDSMKEHLKKTVSNCHSPEVNSDSTHIKPMSWKEKILQELVEAKKKYCNILWDYIRRPGESYSMKTNIYRFPSLVVRYVGKYFDVECPSSWETIDKLVTAEILTPEGADDLRTALAIAAELRLRTYLNNQSQNEHSSSLVELSFLLQRFFCTVVPLEEALNKLPSKSLRDVMKSKLYDDNPKTKVRMYLQFGEYSKAKDILEDICSLYDSSLNIAEAEDLADSFTMLGHIMISQKNASEGTECFKQAVEILERIYQRDPQGSNNRRNLGYGYENFGGSFEASEQFDDALFYTEKSLEIRESLLKENSTAVDEVLYLRDIADSHYNLSALLIKREIRNPSDKHNFATAITHCERTLKVANILLEHYNIVYCNHVVALCGLGYCFYKLDDFKKSFEYFDNALEVLYKNRKYDVFTERELKWVTVCGSASLAMKDWEKARIMYNRAYEILTHIHGDNDDDSVAKLLIDLGRVSEGEEKYEEALEFYNRALEMSKRIHGDGSDNESLQRFNVIVANLALKMKDWEKARLMFNTAHEILTHIHGDNDDDSVAKSLINLGRVSEGEEKYEEALEFYNQAIEMSKRIHGDGSDNESLQRFKAIAFNALLTNIFK